MYRVLIVDDEKIIRIALKSMINWEDLGYQICGSAADSDTALELIHEQQPDLMIIDIMMPKTDGLSFLKLAKQQGYLGEAIILTNHKDFQYAVEALHNGVFDYILKTDISPESLSDILKKVKVLLDAQGKQRGLSSKTYEKNEEVDLIRHIMEYGVNEDSRKRFAAPYLFLEVFLKNRLMHQNVEDHVPQNTLQNIIQEVLGGLPYPVIQSASDAALIIIPKAERVIFISELPALTVKLQKLIKLYMNNDCAFVCSNAFYTGSEFAEKLEHLADYEQLVFYTGFCTVIHEEDLELHSPLDICLTDFQKRIKRALSRNKYMDCKNFLDIEFHRLAEKKPYVSDMLQVLSKIYTFLIFDYSAYLEKCHEELQDIAIKYQTACTLEEYVKPLCLLIDLIERNQISYQAHKYRDEILQINEFIHKNLNKKITLSIIASHVNRSENYLSRLFKAETGVNMITYINQQKMEYAKEMLVDPVFSIKEVAHSLGYDEVSYFNKTFNKFYHINPSDYRKLISL